MNFEITSKNRGVAKRILSAWFDSRQVRTWSLSELDAKLRESIDHGFITMEGVCRALADTTPTHHKTQSPKGDANGDMQAAGGDDSGNDAMAEPADAADIGAQAADAQAQGADASGDTDNAQSSNADADDGNADSQSPAQPPPFQSEQPFVTHPEAEQMRNEDRAWTEQHVAYELGAVTNECEALAETVNGVKLDLDNHIMETRTQYVEVDERLTALESNAPTIIEVHKSDCEPVTIEGAHEMFPDVLRYVQAGLNVALVGPAGTGKSTIAHMAAEALSLEFRGCGALMSRYDLVGYCDANGVYHESPLFQAFTEGHLFCFDELDGSAPDAVVAFNAVTDNQGVYAFPHGMYKKHENFVSIACMNTWGTGASADYVGRFKQDAAAMNRFVRVYIDYDRTLEARLGESDIVERVHAVRHAVNELRIKHVVSTRAIVQMQAARAVGMDNAQLDRDILFAGLDDGQVQRIAAHMEQSNDC